jgi:hypothetical protein
VLSEEPQQSIRNFEVLKGNSLLSANAGHTLVIAHVDDQNGR